MDLSRLPSLATSPVAFSNRFLIPCNGEEFLLLPSFNFCLFLALCLFL